MKLFFSLLFFLGSLSAVDYRTLYLDESSYHNYGVYISGTYVEHKCSERYVDTSYRRKESFCAVSLRVSFDSVSRLVVLEVGSTFERDFLTANRETTFSFDCIYRGNLSRIKDCR